MTTPEVLRKELEREALRLWIEGRSYFDIVDILIERVTMAQAENMGMTLVSADAELEDYETEGRRHAARINGD